LPSYDVTQETPCAMQSPARGLHTIAMRESGLWTELWTGLWTVNSSYLIVSQRGIARPTRDSFPHQILQKIALFVVVQNNQRYF